MFYDYLKSIYNILENFGSESNEFKIMLKINKYFINNLNSHNHKSKINYKSDLYQFGGDKPSEEIDLLKKSIFKMLEDFDKHTSPHLNVSKDINNIDTKINLAKNVIENFTKYIDSLNTFIPDKTNTLKLQKQLEEIKNILNKY